MTRTSKDPGTAYFKMINTEGAIINPDWWDGDRFFDWWHDNREEGDVMFFTSLTIFSPDSCVFMPRSVANAISLGVCTKEMAEQHRGRKRVYEAIMGSIQ